MAAPTVLSLDKVSYLVVKNVAVAELGIVVAALQNFDVVELRIVIAALLAVTARLEIEVGGRKECRKGGRRGGLTKEARAKKGECMAHVVKGHMSNTWHRRF